MMKKTTMIFFGLIFVSMIATAVSQNCTSVPISNGADLGAGVVGDVVTVTCDSGYILNSPDAVIVCVNASTTASWNLTGVACVDINECNSNPCVNGTCQNEVPDYFCNCTSGFSGQNCSIDINECAPNPCMHNGTCMDLVNGYSCNCSGTGYNGETCEIDINDCQPNPCKNSGVCTDTGAIAYVCNCTGTGYNGTICETDIDECNTTNPCMNGNCTNENGSYTCACNTNYIGTNCDQFDDCSSTPCLNNGTCTDAGLDAYTCNCTGTGYEGITCNTDVDECALSTDNCGNRQCTNTIGSFTCDGNIVRMASLFVFGISFIVMWMTENICQ